MESREKGAEYWWNNQMPEDLMESFLMYYDLNIPEPFSGLNARCLVGGCYLFPHFPAIWPQIYNFPIDESDVIISSFPKSGTTWMQQIVYLVTTSDFEGASTIPIDTRVPFLEYPRPVTNKTMAEFAAKPAPRFIKTHLPVNLLPKNARKSKIIYVYRDVGDVIVSFYHHYAAFVGGPLSYNAPFEQFARDFMQGEVQFGPYEKNLLGYYEASKSNPDWLLMVRYEEMKKDARAVISKVAAFLGKRLDDQTLEKIYEATTVDAMRANDAANYSWWEKAGIVKQGHQFIRKGVVGDWKNYFTDPQLLGEFNAYIKRVFPSELIASKD